MVQLTQIGRIFQHAAKGNDVKNMGRSRTQMHETIARANRQFHEALDDVEIQIVGRAQCPKVVKRPLLDRVDVPPELRKSLYSFFPSSIPSPSSSGISKLSGPSGASESAPCEPKPNPRRQSRPPEKRLRRPKRPPSPPPQPATPTSSATTSS